MPPEAILSITELTRAVRDVLEGTIGEIRVEGEIANYRKQPSGHQYFTLKDDKAQLSCVLFFRPGLRHASIPLENGMLVHARGTITVYEARGQYQMNVTQVAAAGAGLLAAKFEALKRKLASEGLFDMARKRPLPRFPRGIGIVTSPSGAVIRDMLNILGRRAPWIPVLIAPARVQGAGAAAEIIEGMRQLEASGKVDLIVLARGGGSTEDLWEFNDEALARAIATASLPIVSAVGHEIDFSISDFTADLRAPTPSAAAELIAPDGTHLAHQLSQTQSRMERELRDLIDRLEARLRYLETWFRTPEARLDALRQRLDFATEALTRQLTDRLRENRQHHATLTARLLQHRPDQLLALQRSRVEALQRRLGEQGQTRLARLRERLAHAASLLRVLGPQATLDRGYSIARLGDGRLLRSTKEAPAGTPLSLQVTDGVLQVRSEE